MVRRRSKEWLPSPLRFPLDTLCFPTLLTSPSMVNLWPPVTCRAAGCLRAISTYAKAPVTHRCTQSTVTLPRDSWVPSPRSRGRGRHQRPTQRRMDRMCLRTSQRTRPILLQRPPAHMRIRPCSVERAGFGCRVSDRAIGALMRSSSRCVWEISGLNFNNLLGQADNTRCGR